ncbi:hypothetical protein TIFTF001_053824 [Ficus carica]|uniref:Uncharacterized protein n=1 Tax=Ficus carica TaxID=3494 RepID=A0AA88EG43_FICCA|nr:hypothetical protein TIFTF001_053824 [Ficus carica]
MSGFGMEIRVGFRDGGLGSGFQIEVGVGFQDGGRISRPEASAGFMVRVRFRNRNRGQVP